MNGLAIGLALGAALAPSPAQGERSRLVVKAARVFVTPDKSIPRGVIVIEDGKITDVGTDLGAPRFAEVHDYGNAVITAGFVDAHAEWGAENEITDTTRAFTPAVRAVDAYRPGKRAFVRAASEGITTVGLSPDAENVAGGIAAVVKAGKARPSADLGVLRADAYLKLSLAPQAFHDDRYPTSFGAAIETLERAWKAAGTDPAKAPAIPAEAFIGRLAPAWSARDARALARARKELRPWFEVADPSAAREVIRLARELKLAPVIVASGDLTDVAAEIAAAKIPVLLAPLDFESSMRQLRMPAALAKAGVEIAFATRGPERGPAALRAAASLAVASGLDRTAALAAITARPARWLGLEERIGTVEPGRDADLVVLSGDPLDMTSAVRATYVRGEVQ